jgi:hypothetical protein
MAAINVGDLFQITFRYSHVGQRLLNVLHYRVEDVGLATDVMVASQQIADFFGSYLVAGSPANLLLELLPSTCTLVDVRAQRVSGGRQAYRFKTVDQPGARGPSEAGNLDCVITKRTDSGEAHNTSPFYLPGIASEDMDNGTLNTTYKDDVRIGMNGIITTLTVGVSSIVLAPVIWYQTTGGAHAYITSLLVQPEVRVMTRRTVGRGE